VPIQGTLKFVAFRLSPALYDKISRVDDFRAAAKQQRFHLDYRLLGIPR
jgi:hypothetical protein